MLGFQFVNQRASWYVFALASVVILVLTLQSNPAWHPWFEFNAALVWQQPWRLLSAHFVHLDYLHAALNLVAWLFITLIFGTHFNARSLFNAVLVIAVICAIGVVILGAPARFVGLSGVVHGLFLTSLLLERRQQQGHPDWLIYAAIAVLCLKILAESFGWQFSGGMIDVGAEVWRIHLAGLIGGVVAFILHRRAILPKSTKQDPNPPTA